MHSYLIVGKGGQGVLLVGEILSHYGVSRNDEVVMVRSYGNEMRGGSVSCWVTMDKEFIYDVLPVSYTGALVLSSNDDSGVDYLLQKAGQVIYNCEMVQAYNYDNGLAVPATSIAASLGDIRMFNMVMLGVIASITGFDPLLLVQSVETIFRSKHKTTFEQAKRAIREGIDFEMRARAR